MDYCEMAESVRSVNTRKLMGMLNAQSPKPYIGSGGVPEITPSSLTAAIGYVDDIMAREVFLSIWWPDGARMSREDLDDALAAAQIAEYAKRRAEMEAAKLQCLLSDDGIGSRSQAQHALAKAREDAWPQWGEMYATVRRAVMVEAQSDRKCTRCEGRGWKMTAAPILKVTVCEKCEGTGKGKADDESRAASIGLKRHTYLRHWRNPYEWLFLEVAAAERRGMRLIGNALG
jgi:hypothetical protein